jgi:hypothetical protein
LLVSKTDLIAMQKVEGSNPFSRFEVNPLHTGNSPFAGGNWNHPRRYAVIGALSIRKETVDEVAAAAGIGRTSAVSTSPRCKRPAG